MLSWEASIKDVEGTSRTLAAVALLVVIGAMYVAALDVKLSYFQRLPEPLETAAGMLGQLIDWDPEGPGEPSSSRQLNLDPEHHSREIGASTVIAAAASLTATHGIYLVAALASGVVFLALLVAAEGAGAGTAAALVIGALGSLNAVVLYAAVQAPQEFMDPTGMLLFARDLLNVVTLAAATVLLAVLHRRRARGEPLAAGLALGAAAGMSNPLVLLLPACVWRYGCGPHRWRQLALFSIGGLMTALPWMLVYQQACGSVFIHPVQGCILFCEPAAYKEPELCDPLRFTFGRDTYVFTHRFLGREFTFMGLLNWPFHDRIVRTPGFPSPVALFVPLFILRSLGTVLSALALIGLADLCRRDRDRAVLLVLWILPTFLLLAANENWSIIKNRYMQPLMPAVLLLAAHGIAWARRGERYFALLVVAIVAIALMLSASLALLWRPPMDSRYMDISSEPWLEFLVEERERGMEAMVPLLSGPPMLPADIEDAASHAIATPGMLVGLTISEAGSEHILGDVRPGELPLSRAIRGTERDAVIIVPRAVQVVMARDGRAALSYRKRILASDSRYEIDLSPATSLVCSGRPVYLVDTGDVGPLVPPLSGENVANGPGWALVRLARSGPCPGRP